ncbi:MAG: hypothetical protein ACYC6L_04565 [Anaerolineae bacterium]
MTNKDSIIYYLEHHPEGIDDDELARALQLNSRQTSNIICRQLEEDGIIVRRRFNGKIRNYWVDYSNGAVVLKPGTPVQAPIEPNLPVPPDPNGIIKKEWFWEGNVQSRIIGYLAAQDFSIRSVANTATHIQGIDIIAEKDGVELWVSVKGYPQGTERTHPSTQAAVWFSGAVFDILEYRGQNSEVLLAIGLPDFQRYRNFAQRISWLLPTAKFHYLWVYQNGQVSEE